MLNKVHLRQSHFVMQGVAQRGDLPPHPEPEVAMIFKKSEGDTAVDLLEVEMALRKALQEVGSLVFHGCGNCL